MIYSLILSIGKTFDLEGMSSSILITYTSAITWMIQMLCRKEQVRRHQAWCSINKRTSSNENLGRNPGNGNRFQQSDLSKFFFCSLDAFYSCYLYLCFFLFLFFSVCISIPFSPWVVLYLISYQPSENSSSWMDFRARTKKEILGRKKKCNKDKHNKLLYFWNT